MKETVDGKKPSGKKKLTTTQWACIKAKFLAGDAISVMARNNGISRFTIISKARREKWGEHGSRKEAIAKEIKAEVETEIIDDYKTAVKKANKEHLDDLTYSKKAIKRALEVADFMLGKKIRIINEWIDAGKDIPADFSIAEEAKIIFGASRYLREIIGATERSILGIENKSILIEDKPNDGFSEMTRVLAEGVAKLTKLREEERNKIRAEVTAEMRGSQTETPLLQS